MDEIYKYEREIHGKQLEYYTQKCKELVEELLEDSSFSKEEKEVCELVHMDLQYDELGSQVLSKEEREEKYEEMIAFYDKHLGVGNEKSHNCRIRMALPLAENRNNKEEQERGFNMLFQQLDILETHNPNAREEIGKIYELISYIYRKYLKNYQYSMIYYQPYLRYIEEDAYYRAEIRRCDYTVKVGQNEYPIYVRGPVETKIKENLKADTTWDSPNYTLTIIV